VTAISSEPSATVAVSAPNNYIIISQPQCVQAATQPQPLPKCITSEPASAERLGWVEAPVARCQWSGLPSLRVSSYMPCFRNSEIRSEGETTWYAGASKAFAAAAYCPMAGVPVALRRLAHPHASTSPMTSAAPFDALRHRQQDLRMHVQPRGRRNQIFRQGETASTAAVAPAARPRPPGEVERYVADARSNTARPRRPSKAVRRGQVSPFLAGASYRPTPPRLTSTGSCSTPPSKQYVTNRRPQRQSSRPSGGTAPFHNVLTPTTSGRWQPSSNTGVVDSNRVHARPCTCPRATARPAPEFRL